MTATMNWHRVDTTGGIGSCWPWTGAVGSSGYGVIGGGPRGARWTKYAHRLAAEAALGPCPAGLHVRHLCGNRLCCNPLHLAYGTPKENAADMAGHGRHYSPFTRLGRAVHRLNPRGTAYRLGARP